MKSGQRKAGEPGAGSPSMACVQLPLQRDPGNMIEDSHSFPVGAVQQPRQP